MLFVAASNIVGFIFWVMTFLGARDRIRFVGNHLQYMGRDVRTREGEAELERFVRKYLQQDGVFLLRLISHNVNMISTSEVTCALWDKWKEQVSAVEKKSDDVLRFADEFEEESNDTSSARLE